jgi:hypothetical protein
VSIIAQEQVQPPRPHPILNPAVVCGKGRPQGSKNKAKGHGITATRRDPSQFEYTIPSSSAPAVLSCPRTELAVVISLLTEEEEEEEEEEQDNNNEFIDINAFDNKGLIDPRL